jgi:L-amino acid N-acyltransferase YncA
VRDTAVSFEVEPPTGAVMAERISGTLGTHPWLVAEREDVVVGFAYAGKHSQRAAYRWTADVTVYVADTERRTGVGRQLYRVLLATLRLQGFRSAFAEIVLPNPGSIRLHEAMGFRHVGIHHDIGHKLGRWHDIGYWRLGLADGPEPPNEPVSFATLMRTPAFDDVLAQIN